MSYLIEITIGISRVSVKATHQRMTTSWPLQEIIDNRINIRTIVRHSVPIIYAQLDVDIDTHASKLQHMSLY